MSKGLEQFNKLKTWYILKMVEGNELLLRNNEKEMLDIIEKKLKAYETLLNVLFGPYVYNDGHGSNGWYLISSMPGEKVEIPITEKDANVLIQAGIKERQDKE